jgi:hypothetical protein
MSQSATVCPTCGSDRVAPIVFGFPDMDLVQEAEAGLVVLGGCDIPPRDVPRLACLACEAQWT